MTRADGFIPRSRETSPFTEFGSAMSVLVTTILSAAATCLKDSGLRSRWRLPFTASTVVRTRSTEKWCCKTGSVKIVWRIGAGSARPVVSTTTRFSRGISSLWSMFKSSMRASTRSSRVVQHTHPLPSRTVRSSTRRRRWWSGPPSPNSLTRTAVSDIEGSNSTLPRSVVFPLPRKPVTTVTGRLVPLSSMVLPVVRRGQRLLQGGIQGIRRPARQLRDRRPERAEILDEFHASCAIAEHVFAPAPVLDPETVVAQHLVRQGRPMDAVPAPVALVLDRVHAGTGRARPVLDVPVGPVDLPHKILPAEYAHIDAPRSEERRVGNECRSRWSPS